MPERDTELWYPHSKNLGQTLGQVMGHRVATDVTDDNERFRVVKRIELIAQVTKPDRKVIGAFLYLPDEHLGHKMEFHELVMMRDKIEVILKAMNSPHGESGVMFEDEALKRELLGSPT